MSESLDQDRPARRGRIRTGGLIGILFLFATVPAAASPIRNSHHLLPGHATYSLEAYFQHALTTHSLHVHGPMWWRILHPDRGLLPETPFVRYLDWRRGLHPVAFARFHPRLNEILRLDQQIRAVVYRTPLIQPQPGPTTPQTFPQQLAPPPQTPEPSSWLIAVLLAGGLAWARHRRRDLR
jgi:hypothetical protein